MRRNHFLALHMLDPPVDSVTLLIGAEADRERRRSSQISTASHEQIHRRLPHLFSGHDPGVDTGKDHEDEDEDEDEDAEESGPGFLGRVNNYRRHMHAHTKHQLDSPATGTLPRYKKTMHAFTLNQLNHHRNLSKSETSSPHLEVKRSMLPSKMCNELSKLSLDELPHGPSNTPEKGEGMGDVQGIDFRKLRRRSLTEPSVASDFAVVKTRDFGAVSAAAAV